MPLRAGMALAGRFIKQNRGGCSGVERLDAAGHGDTNAGIGAAFDFFGQACAFVANEKRDGLAPIHFPWREDARFAVARLMTTDARVRTLAILSCVSRIGSDMPGRIGR